MAIILAVFLISGFFCTNSQYIYLNEKKDCNSNEKIMQQFQTLLTQQKRFQRELGQLRQDFVEIKDLLTNPTSPSFKVNVHCMDLYMNGHTQSGVYKINPFGNETQINIYCDMVTEGGGWTAIQKRRSGSVNFTKAWAEYKNGFGDPEDSYWIGNEVIHQLTKGRNSSLYVSITLQNGTTFYELYDQFSVSDETDNYKLFLGGPATGTLGDSMLNTSYSFTDLSGMYFSTPDRDNDKDGGNCAASHKGGWWFNRCYYAFLNGLWPPVSWVNPWYPTVPNGCIKEYKGDCDDDKVSLSVLHDFFDVFSVSLSNYLF